MEPSNLLYDFEVPIYYTHRNKKMLLGFNQVIPLHPYTRNNLKKWMHAVVAGKVIAPETYDGQYKIEYELWYEHARVDPSNVIGITEKMVLDALQECGALLNDNVNCHKGSTYTVMGADKERPRVEVKVYRVE